MVLIFGGAYQGKYTWAAAHEKTESSFDCREGFPTAQVDLLYHLEALSRRCAETGEDPVAFLEARWPLLENSVVICREIGAGVVPVDRTDRLWREENGRMLTWLAKRADRVVRIAAGLPEVLK